MAASDPTVRRLNARAAAHQSWAKTVDRSARTAPARKAALDRFERQVDPDGLLPEDVRRKMAESARKAHNAKLLADIARARLTATSGGQPDAAA